MTGKGAQKETPRLGGTAGPQPDREGLGCWTGGKEGEALAFATDRKTKEAEEGFHLPLRAESKGESDSVPSPLMGGSDHFLVSTLVHGSASLPASRASGRLKTKGSEQIGGQPRSAELGIFQDSPHSEQGKGPASWQPRTSLPATRGP